MVDENPQNPFTSNQARDNWLKTQVPREVWELPTSQLGDFLRNEGIRISNQHLGDIRRQVLGIEFYQSRITNLQDIDEIPVSWVYERHGYQLSANFQHRLEYDIRNKRTGEVITGKRGSISTDSLLTVGDAKEIKTRQLESGVGDTEWIVVRIELLGVLGVPGVLG